MENINTLKFIGVDTQSVNTTKSLREINKVEYKLGQVFTYNTPILIKKRSLFTLCLMEQKL